jgi:hypothetical protein
VFFILKTIATQTTQTTLIVAIVFDVKTRIRIFPVPKLTGFGDWLHFSLGGEADPVDASVDVLVELSMGPMGTIAVFD